MHRLSVSTLALITAAVLLGAPAAAFADDGDATPPAATSSPEPTEAQDAAVPEEGAIDAPTEDAEIEPESEPVEATVTEDVTAVDAGESAASTVAGGGVTPLPPGTHRLAGADRYATAVAISSRFGSGVSKVYIATGVNYPDALSAAAVAAAEKVPLLLVLPDSIPSVVWAELDRLDPESIIVAGGPSTISSSVVAQLKELAPVTRVAGADRFETSRLLAEQGGLTGGASYIATGLNFPDALSSAAAAGAQGSAVVLVNGGAATADAATFSTLSTIGTDSIRIAGSSGAVSNGVRNALAGQYPVTRYAGADRFETGALINADAFSAPSTVYLALGTNFPDALAGGALAGATNSPLFIVRSECIPTAVSDLISQWDPSTVVLLGSSASLGSAIANLEACPRNPGDVVDCANFSSWHEAQAWYNTYYPYYGDVANLDADKDGLACEHLPGGPDAPPAPPANPGNAVNCSDFATWAEAQGWFNFYYPHYGDIAELDGDGDMIACESLPGAP